MKTKKGKTNEKTSEDSSEIEGVILKTSKKPTKEVRYFAKDSSKPKRVVKKTPSKPAKKVKKTSSKPKKIVKKSSKKPSKEVKKTSKKPKEVVRNSEKSRGVGSIISTGSRKSSKFLKRAGTGISGFDKMIEGGFERHSVNLVAGSDGGGKSIFALRFLIEGVKQGETGIYVTFEEKKEEFYINMKKFGWDLEKYEKAGKFIFLEYSPEKIKMMLDEGGGAIESLVFKHNIKRIVIDSITSFSLLFEDDLSKRQSIFGLFDIIRKWDCTTLFTLQTNTGKTISSIEFGADSVILLYYVNIKNQRQRFIEVFKMRGTNHSKEIRSFEISKSGITIGGKATIERELLES